MAINIYTGKMGSGKSYEVTSSVIVPALADGRRVVSNIDGLDYEAIVLYIVKKYKKKPDEIGSLVPISDDDVLSFNFFPVEGAKEQTSIIQPGDLVVIDEAWRFWNKKSDISRAAMSFFRMHRHYVHPETGVTCDIALIYQSITDVHPFIRAVVEFTFRTVKIKQLGLDKTYRLEVYEGDKLTKTYRISKEVKKYNKDVFPLYNSYSQGGGKKGVEVRMDSRTNAINLKKIVPLAILMLLFFIGGIYKLYTFFSVSSVSDVNVSKTENEKPVEQLPYQSNYIQQQKNDKELIKKEEKYKGYYTKKGRRYYIIETNEGLEVSSSGAYRYEGGLYVYEKDGVKHYPVYRVY
jgi:zona occludens toxin